jgi:hypothetical protein
MCESLSSYGNGKPHGKYVDWHWHWGRTSSDSNLKSIQKTCISHTRVIPKFKKSADLIFHHTVVCKNFGRTAKILQKIKITWLSLKLWWWCIPIKAGWNYRKSSSYGENSDLAKDPDRGRYDEWKKTGLRKYRFVGICWASWFRYTVGEPRWDYPNSNIFGCPKLQVCAGKVFDFTLWLFSTWGLVGHSNWLSVWVANFKLSGDIRLKPYTFVITTWPCLCFLPSNH